MQAKLRLEMSAERDRQSVQKELDAKEEELEQTKYNLLRKVLSSEHLITVINRMRDVFLEACMYNQCNVIIHG